MYRIRTNEGGPNSQHLPLFTDPRPQKLGRALRICKNLRAMGYYAAIVRPDGSHAWEHIP